MSWPRCLLLHLLLSVAATGQPVTLEHLLKVERSCWGPAWISSGFHDWRTVSRYRSRAGLHLGYDIAMPYGCPVAAAWPGKVVAVTAWTSSEYGITVRAEQGWEVTYGHLSPVVRLGQWVETGTVIGTIASDHVDVKMRDADGSYVAFAEVAPRGAPRTREAVRTELARVGERATELRKILARAAARRRRSTDRASQRLEQGRSLAERGLLSERELRELESAAALRSRDEVPFAKLASLREELVQVEQRLAKLQAEAEKLGLSSLPQSSEQGRERDKEPAADSERERLWSLGLISARERERRDRPTER